jgi:outer membrane protein OmpA-like peptidoglycan-associated protein
MKSIDDFNNNTENLENESVDRINPIPVGKSKDVVSEYKEKEVKVLFYNKDSKIIAFDFDDAKIQMSFDKEIDVSHGTIKVKYKGTVGTSDFEVKIK